MDTPCREYRGHRDRDGYGKIARTVAVGKRKYYRLHRWVMEMAGHDIEGKIVMHLCDNPACFRYDHLTIGTHADNQRDKANKGRARNQYMTKGATHDNRTGMHPKRRP